MTIQQQLHMSTVRDSLRADVEGWGAEDPRLIVTGKPIGFTPAPKFWYMYQTPMHALADGWKLLHPPQKLEYQVDGETKIEWSWWFVREVESGKV